MDKRFFYDNKRYHTLFLYNMNTFGQRVYKAPIDAGFSCPNIDGTRGRGGCIYCNGGSGYFAVERSLSVSRQLELQIKRIHEKHEGAKVIAYFQSFSNTHAPLCVLRDVFEPVFDNEFVVGISVATRADCIDESKVEYLSCLAEKTKLTVELGLQSVHDSTAKLINRCHSFSEFEKAYFLLKKSGIRVCVHIINGLPDETEEMMLETASVLGKMKPDALKIHSLHILKGTELEKMYLEGKYKPISKDFYVETVVNQLELIPVQTVIERLTGDADKSLLVAPEWSKNKIAVLGAIDRLQAQRNSYQGVKSDFQR